MRTASAAAVGIVPRELRRLGRIERPSVTDAPAFAAVAAAAKALSVALNLPFAEAGVEKAVRSLVPNEEPPTPAPPGRDAGG